MAGSLTNKIRWVQLENQSKLKNQKHALESDQRKINQENDQLKKQIDQMRQSFDDHLGLVLKFSRCHTYVDFGKIPSEFEIFRYAARDWTRRVSY